MIYVSRSGQTYGPYLVDVARSYIQTGQITPDDLVRQEDQTNWLPAKAHPMLVGYAPPPPPKPLAETAKSDESAAHQGQALQEASGKAVGGWLLFLCVILTIGYPLGILLTLWDAWSRVPTGPICFSVINVLAAVGCFVIGSELWMRSPGAVKSAKYFLACLAFFPILSVVAISMDSQELLKTAAGGDLNNEIFDNAIRAVIPQIFWSIFWYQYLKQSKRVQATFPPTSDLPS